MIIHFLEIRTTITTTQIQSTQSSGTGFYLWGLGPETAHLDRRVPQIIIHPQPLSLSRAAILCVGLEGSGAKTAFKGFRDCIRYDEVHGPRLAIYNFKSTLLAGFRV